MNEMSKITADGAVEADRPRPRSRWRLALMISVPLLIAAVALYFWLTGGKTVSTDNAMVDAPVVGVAPEVSGRIVEVAVRENQVVKAGDLLYRIDPAPFRIALLQADAALSTARVQVAQLTGTASARVADIATKAAAVGARVSDVGLAEENFRRQSELMAKGFTTRAQLDQARAALAAARADEAAARADQQSAGASAAAARAMLGVGPDGDAPAVEAANAQRQRALLDLARTEIRAPIAGRVSSTDRLQVGSMALQSLASVNVVGNDGYWIEANFKETQLERIRVGQPATVTIDAVPGATYHARVTGIGAGTGSQFSLLPAQNATGNWVKVTQRVPVRLTFLDRIDRPLVAGWSAKVTVRVAE